MRRTALIHPHGFPHGIHGIHGIHGHAHFDFRHGHWRHARFGGLFGWWWVVGPVAYYYPVYVEGPPTYVSDIEKPIDDYRASAPESVEPMVERDRAVYYAPGDNTGVWFRNGTECAEAQREAGGEGVCLLK